MVFDVKSDRYQAGGRGGGGILSTGSVYVGTESVCYAASGVAEAGSAILFLHEVGGSSATWGGQLSRLTHKGRCLAPDLPGHGQSTGLGFQSVAEYRNAMIGFLDALAIRWPVVIAGVCLGAAVAIDLAIHHPERVAGLILAGLSEGERVTPEDCQQFARGETPEGFVDGMFSRAVSAGLKRAYLKRWLKTFPTVRHNDLVAVTRYPVIENLRRVQHRVILAAGEQDWLISPEEVARLAETAQMGEMALIPGAGSLSMAEQPDLFSQLVANFLDDIRPNIPVIPEISYTGGYRRSRIR